MEQRKELSDRRNDAKRVRDYATRLAHERKPANFPVQNFAPHFDNGDEADFKGIANFSKGLPHDSDTGEPDGDAYAALVATLTQALADVKGDIFNKRKGLGLIARIDDLPGLADTERPLVNPLAGLAFSIQGADAHDFTCPPAPKFNSAEEAAEMAELYWMALLRDVDFSNFEDNPDDQTVSQAADDLSDNYIDFTGPSDDNGRVTPGLLFRGTTQGDRIGPYISQFLILPFSYGTLHVEQKVKTARPGIDYMKDFESWLAVQNGRDTMGQDDFDEPTHQRYIRNMRDLATYVHFDQLYEAYLNACLKLLEIGAQFDEGNPYHGSPGARKQEGFGTFGGPHILTLVPEVATRALKAVWFQKWFVHRRLRPEEFGGRVHVHKKGIKDYDIHSSLLDSAVLELIAARNNGNYLLPMAFPEGSPMHPAYGAGHGTVAGACVTLLKAWFNEDQVIPDPKRIVNDGQKPEDYTGPDLRVGNELDKLAANISIGRNGAGVHWRTDYTASVRLGESIAISLLQEHAATYAECGAFSLMNFDGERIRITESTVTRE